MKKPDKGMIAALFALIVLGAIISWRLLASDETEVARSSQVSSELDEIPTLEELETEAQANPDDPQMWNRFGLAAFQANEFGKAVGAYERATQLDPESAGLWSSLGEARVMASQQDPLPAAAIAAFEKAIEIDQGDERARYFLAVRQDISGDHEGAITQWLALLADTQPGAPWENDLIRTIQQVGQINEIEVETRIAQASGNRDLLPANPLGTPIEGGNGITGNGPTAEQMAAAGALSPSQQQDMAQGMVARLASRLESQPQDVDGWIMLMRSYQQLGQIGDARRARDSAISANPEASDAINAAAESFDIEGQ